MAQVLVPQAPFSFGIVSVAGNTSFVSSNTKDKALPILNSSVSDIKHQELKTYTRHVVIEPSKVKNKELQR